MAQISDLGHGENTLLAVQAEPSRRKTLKNVAEVGQVLRDVPAGNQNIIEIHEDALHAAEDLVHQALKCLRRVL